MPLTLFRPTSRRGRLDGLRELRDLARENARLREEVDRLASTVTVLEAQCALNDRLDSRARRLMDAARD